MGVVERFVAGFNAQTKPEVSVLPSLEGGVGTEDDLVDYAMPEMIEASRKTDVSNGVGDGDTEAEPVRTINNLLDYMGDVAEDLTGWVERELGEGHRVDPGKDRPLTLLVGEIGTGKWKSTRYTVANEAQIVRHNDSRRLVRLVNLGPEVVSISFETRNGPGTQPNTFSLPISKLDGTGPYMPVDLPTQDDVWATPATAGVASIVEVLDFSGIPDGD